MEEKKKGMDKHWTQHEIEILFRNFPNLMARDMTKLLPGRSSSSIKHKASRLGIGKSCEFAVNNYKNLRLEHHYFKALDTTEKNYWFGFLWGDGNITRSLKTLSLGLMSADTYHLEKLKETVGSDATIQNRFGGKHAVLQICSKQMCLDLVSHNLVPRKSYCSLIPNYNQEYFYDFFRGLFDADGSIWGRRPRYSFSLAGTEYVCKNLQEKVIQDLDIKGHLSKKSGCNVWEWTIGGGRQVRRLASHLYADADLYLERKYRKFKELELL
jgi:hypothetical protein